MTSLSAIANVAHTAGPGKQRLEGAAHEFEAQMMKELLKPMTRLDEDGDEGSGGALTELAGEALGRSLSKAGGFGIADRILASLSRSETSSPSAS